MTVAGHVWRSSSGLLASLPAADDMIYEAVGNVLSELAANEPAGPQVHPQEALDAYQAAGGPQVIVRPAGERGRWQEPEKIGGRYWEQGLAGWFEQKGDRCWIDVSQSSADPWWAIWHEVTHSTGAPRRLGRMDFDQVNQMLRSGTGAEYWRGVDLNSQEEVTADLGAVLLGSRTGTVTGRQLDAAEDRLIGWTAVYYDRPGRLQELLSASLADARQASECVLEPSLQAGRDGDMEVAG